MTRKTCVLAMFSILLLLPLRAAAIDYYFWVTLPWTGVKAGASCVAYAFTCCCKKKCKDDYDDLNDEKDLVDFLAQNGLSRQQYKQLGSDDATVIHAVSKLIEDMRDHITPEQRQHHTLLRTVLPKVAAIGGGVNKLAASPAAYTILHDQHEWGEAPAQLASWTLALGATLSSNMVAAYAIRNLKYEGYNSWLWVCGISYAALAALIDGVMTVEAFVQLLPTSVAGLGYVIGGAAGITMAGCLTAVLIISLHKLSYRLRGQNPETRDILERTAELGPVILARVLKTDFDWNNQTPAAVASRQEIFDDLVSVENQTFVQATARVLCLHSSQNRRLNTLDMLPEKGSYQQPLLMHLYKEDKQTRKSAAAIAGNIGLFLCCLPGSGAYIMTDSSTASWFVLRVSHNADYNCLSVGNTAGYVVLQAGTWLAMTAKGFTAAQHGADTIGSTLQFGWDRVTSKKHKPVGCKAVGAHVLGAVAATLYLGNTLVILIHRMDSDNCFEFNPLQVISMSTLAGLNGLLFNASHGPSLIAVFDPIVNTCKKKCRKRRRLKAIVDMEAPDPCNSIDEPSINDSDVEQDETKKLISAPDHPSPFKKP
ncbi:hypothetical protein ACWJJH_15005 [Endozoicomonadaceae bacterium StTr2]